MESNVKKKKGKKERKKVLGENAKFFHDLKRKRKRQISSKKVKPC